MTGGEYTVTVGAPEVQSNYFTEAANCAGTWPSPFLQTDFQGMCEPVYR